jgi:glycosyltransferase involved in cell wall biosynthesis
MASTRQPRRRVLMTHDYPPFTGGGLALSVRELADVLAVDHDVEVVSARSHDHFADDRGRSMGEASAPVGYRVGGLLTAVRKARTADVLVTHWTFSFRRLSTLSLGLGLLLRKPTVCVVHTAPGHMAFNRLRRLPKWSRRSLIIVTRLIMLRCRVVALTPIHADELWEAGIPVTDICPLPVSGSPSGARRVDTRASRAGGDLRVIGVAGELSAVKGSDRLPGLIAHLTGPYSFRIAGTGPMSSWLTARVDALPPWQRSHVEMVGLLEPSDMPAFYQAIDVLLIPSRSEAQPRVVLEAMHAGVIVIAPLERQGFGLVRHGETGLLADVTNPRACADALAALCVEPARVHEMRRVAAAFATQLTRGSESAWKEFIATV